MINKKRILISFLVAILSLHVPACGNTSSSTAADSISTESESEVIINMTEDQKKFLIHNSVNEEAVKEGRLRDWQIELLRKYDFCMEYLSDEYPDHNFEITTYDNINSTTIKFIVIPDNDESLVFTANVFDENGNLTATDSFN